MEVPPKLGPFEPTSLLGEGGSGVVYAARWQGRSVALKVARAEAALTPKEQQRFLQEARLMARIRHSAVVEVLDAGLLPDGRPYLAMTLLEGETLAERLARSGPLPLGEAKPLFLWLADATATLHAEGLVHRDLKPENVMLVDGGRSVKLLDFGIAKELSAPASTTTQSGLARGTPATMAPERFFGAVASESTDVYELALVLYAMLVGSLPWPDATNVDVRLNPKSPREAGADLPEALSATIMRALSTRPERRPPSARALAEAVREASEPSAKAEPSASDARVTQATPSRHPPPETAPADIAAAVSQRDAPAKSQTKSAPAASNARPQEPASSRRDGPPSSQRALAGRTSDKTQVKDVVVAPAPRPSRAALLAVGAALAVAGALVFARIGASASSAKAEPSAAVAIEAAVAEAPSLDTAAPRAAAPTAAAATPPTPSASAESRPLEGRAPSASASPAARRPPTAARPADTQAKAKPEAAPASTAAPAAELPGGVYEKPPY